MSKRKSLGSSDASSTAESGGGPIVKIHSEMTLDTISDHFKDSAKDEVHKYSGSKEEKSALLAMFDRMREGILAATRAHTEVDDEGAQLNKRAQAELGDQL